ncbi:hypothetical protein CP969_24490 [Streptomyces viridosporus T7A]|uniref:Uncharacterized protein n=1 Tax=Streptomyces viridosporus T7A TaxID=665577 RepID=A0ABX6AKH0_STRVD|nr:hypothetical protein CP969_24490 [Streptomyces viridosporus T7A]
MSIAGRRGQGECAVGHGTVPDGLCVRGGIEPQPCEDPLEPGLGNRWTLARHRAPADLVGPVGPKESCLGPVLRRHAAQ